MKKLVKENVDDVLKPKTKQQIKDAITLSDGVVDYLVDEGWEMIQQMEVSGYYLFEKPDGAKMFITPQDTLEYIKKFGNDTIAQTLKKAHQQLDSR